MSLTTPCTFGCGCPRQTGRGRGRGDTQNRGGRGTSSHQVSAFVARVFNTKVCGKQHEVLLDNWATDHVFTDHSHLTRYLPHHDECHFADADISAPVVGKGDVHISNSMGKPVLLRDALHVPSFSSNLVSVSKADSNGGYFSGGKGQMQVTDSAGTVLVTGTLRRGLYHVNCTIK